MKYAFLKFKASVTACLLVFSLPLMAQKPLNPPKTTGPTSMVEVLNSDIQEGVNLKDMQTQTFTGNVIFRHEGVMMGTDRAIQNSTLNTVEAFGNIKINQGDTLTIVGDSLFYEGNQRIATIWGKSVILRDKKVTLRTKRVIYNMQTGMAYYPVSGEIQQDSSRLTSNTGYYNTETKYFNYIGDVEILHPQFVVCTDTMDYDTHSKKAFFKAFTTIRSEDGELTAHSGWYNIQTKESYFTGRPSVNNEDFRLQGDTLDYDSDKQFGWARGNVVFVSKTDSLIAVGDEAIRVGSQGITKLNGSVITKKISTTDTAYLAADTLTLIEKRSVESDSLNGRLSIEPGSRLSLEDSLNLPDLTGSIREDTRPVSLLLADETVVPTTDSTDDGKPKRENIQYVIALGNVKSFQKDLQSISDSLIYNAIDSTITYFNEPVLWSRKNQLKADTIRVFLKNNRVQKMELRRNCFIIDKDTLGNSNQLKGRMVTALFTEDSRIEQIDVFGNAESKFFVLDDDQKILGLNLQQSATMTFVFDEGELAFIKSYTDVDEETVPPNQLTVSKARFSDFADREGDRPGKESILMLKHGDLLESTEIDLVPPTLLKEIRE